jgi:hypothetical protein
MTTLVLTARRGLGEGARLAHALGPWRLAAVAALAALASSNPPAAALVALAGPSRGPRWPKARPLG